MQRIEDIFSKLNGAKYFSTLNLHTGYHKTAFTSPFEKYEYWKVPFGLAQVSAYFQELMNKVLKDLPFTIVYWMILLSTAKLQKNTWTIYSKFSTNFTMQNFI